MKKKAEVPESSTPETQEALLRLVARALAAGPPHDDLWQATKKLRDFVRVLDGMVSVCEVAAGAAPGSSGLMPRSDALGGDGRVQYGLSLREKEVIGLLASGNAVGTIAHRLGISAHTVRNHLKTCFRKLKVHSQIELVNRAFNEGIAIL